MKGLLLFLILISVWASIVTTEGVREKAERMMKQSPKLQAYLDNMDSKGITSLPQMLQRLSEEEIAISTMVAKDMIVEDLGFNETKEKVKQQQRKQRHAAASFKERILSHDIE